MFKRYLNDLFNNKKALIATIISIPIIIYNCTAEDWYLSDLFNQNNEQHQQEEYSQPEQSEQIEQQPEQQPETSTSDVDKAYQFVIENIQFNVGEGIKVNVQKGENSIIIIYTYNETLTEQIKQQGLSESFLFSIAEDLGQNGLDTKQYIKEQLGIDIDIETKLYDSDGNLYVYIYNNQLVELNPVRTTNDMNNL